MDRNEGGWDHKRDMLRRERGDGDDDSMPDLEKSVVDKWADCRTGPTRFACIASCCNGCTFDG